MRPYLLDTHVFVWMLNSPEKLGKKTKTILQSESLVLSTASVLELARLVDYGKLQFTTPLEQWIEQGKSLFEMETIPITEKIALESYRLEDFHRDPIDRILVATSRIHHYTLISADREILAYESVSRLSAKR
jgi:PIN domain nuclease of toxin-antitoxin system